MVIQKKNSDGLYRLQFDKSIKYNNNKNINHLCNLTVDTISSTLLFIFRIKDHTINASSKQKNALIFKTKITTQYIS